MNMFQDSWIYKSLQVAWEDMYFSPPVAAAAALNPRLALLLALITSLLLLFSTALSSKGGDHS